MTYVLIPSGSRLLFFISIFLSFIQHRGIFKGCTRSYFYHFIHALLVSPSSASSVHQTPPTHSLPVGLPVGPTPPALNLLILESSATRRGKATAAKETALLAASALITSTTSASIKSPPRNGSSSLTRRTTRHPTTASSLYLLLLCGTRRAPHQLFAAACAGKFQTAMQCSSPVASPGAPLRSIPTGCTMTNEPIVQILKLRERREHDRHRCGNSHSSLTEPNPRNTRTGRFASTHTLAHYFARTSPSIRRHPSHHSLGRLLRRHDTTRIFIRVGYHVHRQHRVGR